MPERFRSPVFQKQAKSLLISVVFSSFLLCFIHPVPGEGVSGPLYGKNFYLPHLPVYSFPGFSPRSGRAGTMSFSQGYTGVNEIMAYNVKERALDYESSILEGRFGYRILDNLLLGAESRLIFYYPGFMDPVIELWHRIFHFPNGGREFFPRGDIDIFIDNSTGRNMSLSGSSAFPGDTDLFCVWTFREGRALILALAGALKIPTGSFSRATGSGYPDAGVQILGEWLFHPRWSVHLHQGFVLPGDLLFGALGEGAYAGRPQWQSFWGLEFRLQESLSLLLQFRVNSSPIASSRTVSKPLCGSIPLFTLIQNSLQLGFRKAWGDWSMQFYIEEDPFPHEGADILFSLSLAKSFRP